MEALKDGSSENAGLAAPGNQHRSANGANIRGLSTEGLEAPLTIHDVDWGAEDVPGLYGTLYWPAVPSGALSRVTTAQDEAWLQPVPIDTSLLGRTSEATKASDDIWGDPVPETTIVNGEGSTGTDSLPPSAQRPGTAALLCTPCPGLVQRWCRIETQGQAQ